MSSPDTPVDVAQMKARESVVTGGEDGLPSVSVTASRRS
jgi:hypothetical protein